MREKAGFFATPLSPVLSTGPKRLFATIKTEESGRYNLVECIKLSPDGKFKIFVQLKNGLNWLNFEFCRVVRHLVVNCSAKYAQVEQSHKVKLVYIVSSDSNGEFQVLNFIIFTRAGKSGLISLWFWFHCQQKVPNHSLHQQIFISRP